MSKGRPTVMTEETVKKLDEGFSMGFTDEEACFYANISKQTLYNYIEKNPDYLYRKEALKNNPKLLAKRNIFNALEKGTRIEDSKWYLERRDKDFKPKSDFTSDNKPLILPSEVIKKNGINTSTEEDSK